MREFKGRMMKCHCVPDGKSRHTPEIIDGPDGSNCHYYANLCMNCGSPKLTRQVIVWRNYLMDDSGPMMSGRERTKAIQLIRKHHVYLPR